MACAGPSDCVGSTDGGAECCVTVVLADNPDGAAFPDCTVSSISSYCGQCSTDIQLTCTSTEKLHVCAKVSDCASETSATQCCAVFGYDICVSSLQATAGNLTCL